MPGINEYTVLCQHMDTDVSDSSIMSPKSPYTQGAYQFVTGKFGNMFQSLAGPPIGRCWVDAHADLDFDDGAFTIEFWWKFTGTTVGSMYQYLKDGNNYWHIAINGNDIYFRIWVAGIEHYTAMISDDTLSAGTLYHIELGRTAGSGGSFYGFLNGVLKHTTSVDGSHSDLTIAGNIGIQYALGTDFFYDEITVTKGLCKHTADFDVPTVAYSADSCSTPVATPTASTLYLPTSVTLSTATSGASIYYTTNGDSPTSGSTLYTGPITIASTMTLKAIAIRTGYINSSIMSEAYTYVTPAVSTPVANPDGGDITEPVTVTITCATSGASLYFTTDGTTPTSGSTPYLTPILIYDTTTLKVLAQKTYYSDAILTETYTFLTPETPEVVVTGPTVIHNLTAGYRTSFYNFGLGANSALYGANGLDCVFKAAGSPPAFTSISDSPPLDCMTFSNSGRRMFGAKDHTIYWTEIQSAFDDTTNIETWKYAAGTNSQSLGEDSGSGFTACVEVNEVMLFFQDSGVWALTNPAEAPTDWEFPQISSMTGTKSPQTVCIGNYGINKMEVCYFLASNKEFCMLEVSILRNSGKIPSVEDKSRHRISNNFQSLLNDIPDAFLSSAIAKYWNGYVILNFASSIASANDTTIVIDTTKLLPKGPDETVAQPYFFQSSLMDFSDLVVRVRKNELYGFHIGGFIQQLFTSKTCEEVPTRYTVTPAYSDSGTTRSVAIEYSAYLGWIKAASQQILCQGVYVKLKFYGLWTGVYLTANSFTDGADIPNYDEGIEEVLRTKNVDIALWGRALWGVTVIGSSNYQISQFYRLPLRGNYFLWGIKSTKLNEVMTVYSIQPVYKQIRTDQMGKRS